MTISTVKTPIEFGKNYNTTFGTMNYSTRTLRLSGDVRFGYNEKFGTVYVLLDDDSEKVIEKLNHFLKNTILRSRLLRNLIVLGFISKLKGMSQ